MKIHQVKQNTAEWRMLRSGIPTASKFDHIITPKKLERSSQLEQYARELAAERILGRPLENIPTEAMSDGIWREDQAIASYELDCGMDTEAVGFVTTNDGRVGASPDRIWPNLHRLVEAKNPKVAAHMGYLLGKGPDEKHTCQLQGQLYVCDTAESVDIISCYPGLPDVVVNVKRDEKFQAALKPLLDDICALVDLYTEKLTAMGYAPMVFDEDVMDDRFGVSDADVTAILEGRDGK